SWASQVLPIATLGVAPYSSNNTATPSTRISNATCTINIPSASVDYWYPPTYSHIVATITQAPRTTNALFYSLIPHNTTFDVASAIESDFVCTMSESYLAEWDYTVTICNEYTEKPTAAATSIAYRSAYLPFTGIIPASDVGLYNLYDIYALPPATATVLLAPNVTQTETSATPFVYFTAYEVESGNKTTTVQLRSPQAYPYWLKGVEHESTATGTLPAGFLEQIPQSACDAGQLQATVTVLIVVDLYYQNQHNADPFLVHFESSVLGFDDPPDIVNVNKLGTSSTQALTVSDWGLPVASVKPTPRPNSRPDPVPTTQAPNGNNNAGSQNAPGPNAQQPTKITVGTIGTEPVVIGPSSEVVVGSQTLKPGGPPITLGGGTPVFLAPSATAIVVGGTTSQLPQVFAPPAQPQPRPPPVLTIGSSTLVPNAATQFFVGPGQTLTPGGVATVDGTVISLAPSASFVVIGGSTQVLSIAGPGTVPVATSPPRIVVGGSTITAQPNQEGRGSPSNQNNASPGPSFVVGDQTLAPGGPAITVSGTTLSLAPSGSFVVVNGVTSSVATPAVQANTPPTLTMTAPPLTIGDAIFSPLPGTGTAYVIGSFLLTPGGSIVITGTTISLAPGATALIINGQTSYITQAQPTITNPPLLTIGSQTYTAVSGAGTTFVIGGQILTPGGTITVDGTTISLALGATELIYGSSGRSTTTALFPATTTRTQSVTGTSRPSAGASGFSGQAAATSQGLGAAPRL
ncbi:hypothetical protein EJ02DRAFT_313816, partial [Clathrospora elynae]